ncbi:MAG: hemolysin family protein [Lachnospiraceae bacterium]|nr:hemolysin family protein [Lachnospiraceae bacterium]
MEENIIQTVVLIILLALSGFFSSAETALTTVNRIRLRTMAEGGDKRAELALTVTEDMHKMLSAILIGNNIVNLSASSLATMLAVRLLGSYGAGVATGILTLLILIFGEITPKNMATVKATELSLKVAGIIKFLMTVLTPIIVIVNFLSGGLMRLLGVVPGTKAEGMTEEEFLTIVDVGSEKGIIEEDEKDYINNIFDFSDTTAREVMIPRIDVTMVNVNWSYEKLMSVFSRNMFTRMPVFEGDTDHVIGMLNMKDLLTMDNNRSFAVRDYLREAYFTFEQKNTSDLFEEMRRGHISQAIVLDEYGAVAGIVALEDLLEELVGEIRDEYDFYEEDDIKQIGDFEYVVNGSMNLEDLCEELSLPFTSEDYDTIGGYLIGEFDHFPKKGETYVSEDGIILSVYGVRKKRIEKVRIKLPEVVSEDSTDGKEEEDVS